MIRYTEIHIYVRMHANYRLFTCTYTYFFATGRTNIYDPLQLILPKNHYFHG